jgi:diguanylate cyclase (GGDEF)-like protein
VSVPDDQEWVLVVDDDPVARAVARHSLLGIGAELREAVSGEGALAMLASAQPALVLLDLGLPDVDGLTVCRRIRSLTGGADLPIAIMTGSTDFSSIDSAFEAGATDFLTKPLNPRLLQHRVRFQLRASRAAARLRDTLANLERSEKRLSESQLLARLGYWEWDPAADSLALSSEACVVLEVAPGEITSLGDYLERLADPSDAALLEKALANVANDGHPARFDLRLSSPRSGARFVHHSLERTHSHPGLEPCVQATIQDVSERRAAEEQIRTLAFYDPLTGLPNRRLLAEKLESAVAYARESGEIVAVLFVDVDRFKRVNDSLGHLRGDRLLQEVASRLVESVRGCDLVSSTRSQATVSRFGGDEFIVVLTGLVEPSDAAKAARRLIESLRRPIPLDDHSLSVSVSIGIVCAPSDGVSAEDLLRKADAAMYHAKERGRGGHFFYDPAMNETAERKLAIETQLTHALAGGALRVHYQPQLDVRSGRVAGCEALLRWPLADGRWVPPSELIPVAEESGLIVRIGDWVLRTATRQLAAWRRAGWALERISVNVSERQLRPGFLASLDQALAESGLAPGDLELEITESAFVDPDGASADVLREAAARGISIAVDDFGIGYSSLAYLARLPLHALKIDASFVRQIAEGRGALVTAIVALAQHLGLRVVAEGVETAEQESFLRQLGPLLLQGYRIGRPAAPEDLLL